jgi:hypothetical protein
VYYPRPVFYRPALVAFFSFGGGSAGGVAFGGAFGFGNIGWCALAPFETFHPWYGRGFGRSANVTTVTNVTVKVNITRVYRNLNAPGGAVAVNNGSFANGNFAHPIALDRATPIRGVLPVVPTAANLAYSAHAAAPLGSAPLAAARFARFTTQPRTAVAPFAAQQRRVQSAAIASYPEHAAEFQHPDAQRQYDRPGLTAAPADAAGSKREDATPPNADSRRDVPADGAVPSPAYRAPVDREPAYREPATHDSEYDAPAAHPSTYRAPAYHAPVAHTNAVAPKYRAPAGHAPAQVRPKKQPPPKS